MNELLEMAERTAIDVSEGFTRPDDDWSEMLFIRNRKTRQSKVTLLVFATGIPGGDKNDQASTIAGILRQHRAIEAVLVQSSWSVSVEKEHCCDSCGSGFDFIDYRANNPRPSEHADREEVLSFTYVSEREAKACIAHIARHSTKPPTLGALEFQGEGIEFGGRYVDAMRLGITDSSPTHPEGKTA